MFDDLDEDLVARVHSADAGVRRVAMMDLAEEVEPAATMLLIAGLRDDSEAVREAAARGLDEHEGSEAALALAAALDDPSQVVRAAVAEALADRKEPGIGPALIERCLSVLYTASPLWTTGQ